MANYMTKSTFDRLSEKLNQIQTVEIPTISKAKKAAAEEGDLSENAEYIGCKEKLELLHSQYDNLKQRIANPIFINDIKIPGTIVSIGTIVEVRDLDADKVITYTILGVEDADTEKNIISYTSPLAKGMIGKKPEQTIIIDVPEGKRNFKIISVKAFNK